MEKGKSIYFSKKELENLMEFYNHWDDKLTADDGNFYSFYIGKVGSAFYKIANALQRDNNIVLKPYRATNVWEPIVNAHGELTEFICDCGCSSQGASNYCPDCGTKMDNSDIEERIQKAIREAI